jgi:metallophosphoesterase superfamily enzyme
VRQLLVSDLHIGTRQRSDILRRDDVLAALVAGLEGVDRLVLLGDTVELRHGPQAEALQLARPMLEAVGGALGAEGEVLLLPGNHDHALLRPWIDRRRRDGRPPPMALTEEPDWHEDEPLARIAGWVAPASLRVAYPGVWLRDDVWATHGHYLDPHFTIPTFERLAAGVMRRVIGPPPRRAAPDDYERVLEPAYAWMHAMAQHAGDDGGLVARSPAARVWRRLSEGSSHRPVRWWALRASFGLAVASLNRAGLGPLQSDVSGVELRRAGLRALGEVTERLGVAAPHVVFGHTHRAGPRAGDDLAEWRTPEGTRLWNTGTWVLEGHFLATGSANNPYWPGAAIRIEETGDPQHVRLLGEGPADGLRPGRA